jgi:ERF superfamily
MNELQQHPAFATPMNMLERAVSSGAPMEMIEKLMALVERRERHEARKAFDAALAQAAAELPTIAKKKLVDFTSAKGRTRYMHEGLDDITEAVRPGLGRFGLSFRFRLNEDAERLTVTCIIAHADGYSEENSLSAPRDDSGQKNVIQAKGSTVTYLQRYTLKASLGLAAAIDDDGRAAGGPAPAAKITPEQAAQILALCTDLADQATTLAKIKNFTKVTELTEIPASEFQRVLGWLNKKKQAETSSANAGEAHADQA